MYQSTLDGVCAKLVDSWRTLKRDVNQVSIQKAIEYWSRVKVEGIHQHSTMDAISTHDPFWTTYCIYLVTSIINGIYHKFSISNTLYLKISYVTIIKPLHETGKNIFLLYRIQSLKYPGGGVLHETHDHVKMVSTEIFKTTWNILTLLLSINDSLFYTWNLTCKFPVCDQ